MDEQRRWWVGLAVAAALVLGIGLATDGIDIPANFGDRGPTGPLTVTAYQGHGAWVDVFDYLPVTAGDPPPVTPDDVADMAEAGVTTLYLQAAFESGDTPGLLTDEALLGRFLAAAHLHGVDVVGWYLPRFADVGRDLEHLVAIRRAELEGHRFDGVAVDIEFTGDVADPGRRSNRLVDLSARLDDALGRDVVGAIVLPPVLIEVVNPGFWPGFPWRAIAEHYDVWQPMSYWTQRTEASGFADGYRYNEQSTRRLRANLGDSDAVVHGIGGIGDEAVAGDIDGFARSLVDTDAVGGSIYDWNTLGPQGRSAMSAAFEDGPASSLARQP